jgi:DNA helicase HerA-like ATPase
MSAKSNAGRVGVWGASGSGKSSYVKLQMGGRKRVVIFDPQAEYTGTAANSVDAVRREMARNWSGFRISYRPPPGKEPGALSALCKLLIYAQQPFKETGRGAGLALVVEEMNLSFPVSGGAAKCPGFAEVCSRGRHYGIEVWGVSQRIAEVDTRFRGNCTETVVFRQKGARDQAAAALELGCKPVDLPRENLAYLHERAGRIESGKLDFSKKRRK